MSDQNEAEVSHQPLANQEQEIAGGEIRDLDQDSPTWRAKHHAETASRLAFVLVWVLVGSIVAYLGAAVVLTLLEEKEAADAVDSVFGKWLPVISGFVGGAVTYYFTREKR